MKCKFVPIQVELPKEIHSKFKSKCAVDDVKMKAKVVELVQNWVMLKEINQIGEKK